MATAYAPVTFTTSPRAASWCFVLLEHLDEFATLAWYLVADGELVEDTFSRAMAKLDRIQCDVSTPEVAYNQARNIIITEAIAIVSELRRDEDDSSFFEPTTLGRLPDLPRLAFMLRLIIRSSEAEVAKFLNVSPSEVKGLVRYAIDRLSVLSSFPASSGWHDA
jgi:DNA-directed RNA polymerase specialized sigma24 family protein